MSKYLLSIILFIVASFGWWLWHHEGADWIDTFCGACVFFGMLSAIITILIFAPSYLSFNQYFIT